jgi:uncharacterized protein YcbK (DUF882 family)
MGDISHDFSRSEFACHCGCGGDTVDAGTLTILQDVRYQFLQPVKVNSGFRCASHNRKVGGASNSQHLTGRAADISVKGISPQQVADYLNSGPLKDKGGIGTYSSFVHVDTRSGPPARWKGGGRE